MQIIAMSINSNYRLQNKKSKKKMSAGSNILPPKIQQHSSSKFGQLKVQIVNISVDSTDGMPFTPVAFDPQFLGEEKQKTTNNVEGSFSAFKTTKIGQSKCYDILATLWHFYVYLNDMDFIKIKIFRKQLSNYEYFCKLPINLKNTPNEVLNCQFCSSDLLKSTQIAEKSEKNCVYKYSCDIWDQAGRIIGFIDVQISLCFDLDIHQQLIRKRVIDFSQMLVIDGISRIGSMGSSENLISQRAFNPKNRQNNQTQKQVEYIKNLSQQFSRLQKLQKPSNHNENMFRSVSEFQFSSLQSQNQKSKVHEKKTQYQQNLDEQKVMNDQIDRLVAEMQAKPYDSSRYQQNETILDQRRSQQKISEQKKSQSQIQIEKQDQQRKTVRETKFPPLPSSLHKTHSSVNITQSNNRQNYHQTMNNFDNSHNKSVKSQNYSHNSPLQKSTHTKRVNFQDNTTPYNNFNQIPSQISVNSQNQKSNLGSRVCQISSQNDIESYKLHIHELLVTGSNISSHMNALSGSTDQIDKDYKKYELSIFIMDQYNQQQHISTLVGLPDQNQGQGCSQTITFNHSSVIPNSLKSSQSKIDKIRFQLKTVQFSNEYEGNISRMKEKESLANNVSFFKQLTQKRQSRACLNQKQVFTQGYFDINKLLNSNKIKGVFMIPIMHTSHNDISISKTSLVSPGDLKIKKVELPTYKTLRIQVQAVQNLDKIVQLYTNINSIKLFKNDFNKVKYKVPYTKDTIQFTHAQLKEFPHYHFNIFPHSKKFQTLIFQFWSNDSITGMCEVNLSKMSQIPYQTLVSGTQPIFLYDGTQQIRGLVNRNTVVGEFDLILCFGTVKQVQIMLKKQNEMMKSRLKNRKDIGEDKKAEVQFDKKLGILVKQKKTVSCIQIQVQGSEFDEQETPMQLKIKPSLKQQQLQINQTKKINAYNNGQQKPHQLKIEGAKSFSNYSDFLSRKHKQLIPLQTKPKEMVQSINVNQNIQNQFDNHNIQQTKLSQKTICHKGNKRASLPSEGKRTSKFLVDQISDFIAENLTFISKQSTFALLKQRIKPHTLYNFIKVQKIKDILENLPITDSKHQKSEQIFLKRKEVNTIIDQILMPKSLFKSQKQQMNSDAMLNVKILYDMILSLQLNNGKIKHNLIPEYMIGYRALQVLYGQTSQQEDILFDQDTQWSDVKVWMIQKGYKVTMHEYNAIQQFLTNYIQEYQKHSKVQKSKDPTKVQKIKKMIIIELRDQIRKCLIQKQFQKEKQKMEEQEIIKNLYAFDSSLNESVSRDHQSPNFQRKLNSPFKSYSQFEQDVLRETVMNKHRQDFEEYIPEKTNEESQLNQSQNQFLNQTKKKSEMIVSFRDSQFSQKQTKNEIFYKNKQVDCFAQAERSSLQGQLYVQVSGIETCREACQYLFDKPMEDAQLRILIKIWEKSQFLIAIKNDCKINVTQLLRQNDIDNGKCEKIEGKVTLYDPKNQKQLSTANFCLINGVNSVYTMKSKDGQFCGLIHLQLKQN